MILRQYQRDFINAVMASFRAGDNFTLAQLPTGGGKTIVFSTLIKECVAEWGIKCLILAHRGKLIEQAKDKLLKVAPELGDMVGVYSAGLGSKDQAQVTIATIQSLKPEAVVIATGAQYDRSGVGWATLRIVPGVDADYVLMPEDVLNGVRPVGQHVVIYDDTGYIVGPGLAELLADQGKNVEIVTSQSMLASTVVLSAFMM